MDIDHIHIYTYRQRLAGLTAQLLKQFGFQPTLPPFPSPPELVTRWIHQGDVLIALSAGDVPTPTMPTAYLTQHPPGVVDLALRVPNLERALARAIAAGAQLLTPRQTQAAKVPGAIVRWATVSGLGDLRHTLVEREVVKPEVTALANSHSPRIDHAVINVPQGELAASVQWYQRAFGLEPQQFFQIETPDSGLRSQVLRHPQGTAQIPINEPTSTRSQIHEFLDINHGIGIQHVAIQTPDLLNTVTQLRRQGVEFLAVPTTYYRQLEQRGGRQRWPDLRWDDLAQQQILIDWADDTATAPLLQIFTTPILAAPTFFFEFIQRVLPQAQPSLPAAQGFGEGNFQALFEAIERAQLQR